MARKPVSIIAILFMVCAFTLKANAQQQPPASGNSQVQGQASQIRQEMESLRQQAEQIRSQLEQLKAQAKPLREQLRSIREKMKDLKEQMRNARQEGRDVVLRDVVRAGVSGRVIKVPRRGTAGDCRGAALREAGGTDDTEGAHRRGGADADVTCRRDIEERRAG